MASTRHPQPLKIFQDPDLGFDFDTTTDTTDFVLGGPLTSPLDSLPPLPPNSNGFSNVTAGPVSADGGNSPTKQSQPSSSPPSRVPFSDKLNVSLPPPLSQSFATDSPLKRHNATSFQPIAPNQPSKALFPSFPNTDKENMGPYTSDNLAEFPSDPSATIDGYKRPEKRALQTIDGLMENNNSKKSKKKIEVPQPSGPVFIPEPQDMPVPHDNGGKPNSSYAQLIGMAILRAPNRRLTLAQIYKWISDTYSHYQKSGAGWQNSIRHNLSLNEHFIKQDRPKDDPGKGSYWTIRAGEEHHFLNQKSRRPTSSSASLKAFQQPSSEANIAPIPAPPPPREEIKVSVPEEPSSDATIILSDPALLEDDDEPSMPPPPSRGPLSSPIDHIRSSPPVPRVTLSREGTPCHDEPSSAHNSRSRGSRKRKHTAGHDSGYFSSLESSALRPHLFPSDPSIMPPRFKRGRAEEEIARIRSSSHDISPTRARTSHKPSPSLLSSSPTRPRATDATTNNTSSNANSNNLMLPPLTPAVTFKKPTRPAPAISPNTNLRNHRNKIRELIGSGSPLKPLAGDELSFSPAFNILEDAGHDALLFGGDSGFGVFVDRDSPVARKAGSPVKRVLGEGTVGVGVGVGVGGSGSGGSARRARASAAAGVLADVTGGSVNAGLGAGGGTPTGLTPNPMKLEPPCLLGSPLRHMGRSPSKIARGSPGAWVSSTGSPTRGLDFGIGGGSPFKGDFWGLDLFLDVDGGVEEDEFGLDLLGGGWRAIGEKNGRGGDELGWDVDKENLGAKKGKGKEKKARPVMGARRETTRF